MVFSQENKPKSNYPNCPKNTFLHYLAKDVANGPGKPGCLGLKSPSLVKS